MRTIPITPEMLTGDFLDSARGGTVYGPSLVTWADALLAAGFDSDAIIQVVANPEMHWEKVTPLFTAICREIGLSQDILAEIATVKQEVMIEEYRRGKRPAADLIWHNDDLRKAIGFPEPLHRRLLEDNEDGTNDSGIYNDSLTLHGEELETLARQYLERAGIRG